MSKSNVVVIEQTDLAVMEQADLAVVDYNVTEAFLAEMRVKHAVVPIAGNKDLAIVQKSITELTTIRTTIEKSRVEKKAKSIAYGKMVDSEAERVTDLIREIEKPLVDAKKAYNDEQERIKAEEAAKEKVRIDTAMRRMDSIRNRALEMAGKTAHDIGVCIENLKDELEQGDGFDYMEFKGLVQAARNETLEKLTDMQIARGEWEKEQVAETARKNAAEAARIKLEADQAKLKEDQRIFDEEKAEAGRAEAEKKAAEDARLAEIEEKSQSVKRELAVLDAQKTAHAEQIAADKLQQERDDNEREANRVAALQMEKDAEKIRIEQAAPVMLAALEEILEYVGNVPKSQAMADMLRIVQPAITAARGQA